MKTTARVWSRRKRREHEAARAAIARVLEMAAEEPHFFAMELADAFVEYTCATPEERERIEWVAMCVGTYLYEVGRPGAWASIHIPEMDPWLAGLQRPLLEEFAFTLAWLISYLGTCADLSPGSALRILSELAQWCEDRDVRVDVIAAARALPVVN